MAGKPVLFGPHMENFATLAKALVLNKGAIEVRDVDSLELTVANLLGESEARRRIVQSAHQVLSKHQGATARAAALIHELSSEQ
jgi:3-deoxy-D-manno-octulosonic-acid transferase